MTDIDRSQFYSGGFFLIRAGHPGWKELDAELLPEKVISLSRCLSPRLEIVWTWHPRYKDLALEFGIPDSKWDEFNKWCSDDLQNQNVDMYGMFNSKEVAKEFICQFIPDVSELFLIEVGLPAYLGDNNWREQIPDDSSAIGVDLRIMHKRAMSEGGQVLGFEVVSYTYHDFGHSWICSHIHQDMHQLYGITPNEQGFLDSFDDAKKVHEWIAQDEMRGRRGEPEPYDFWLLVSHQLEETENPPS